METEKLIIGFILFAFGGLSVVRPDLVMSYKIWSSKKFFGADYKPTKRTFKVQKILGVFFVFLALLIFTNSI